MKLTQTNFYKLTTVILLIVLSICFVLYFTAGTPTKETRVSEAVKNVTPETQDEKIHSISNGKVDVFKRRILSEDKYYLKISTGFQSSCTWNYMGGNKGFRYIETTNADSSGVHTLVSGDFYNFAVHCVDDGGLNYDGNFIKEAE